MVKDRKEKIKIISILIVIVSLFLIMIVGINYYKNPRYNKNLSNYYALSYDTSDFVYLSDLNYDSEKSFAKDGYYIRKDKDNNSNIITLNVDGNKKSFIKGISAWATSNLIYDLSDLDYDYFTSYIGVSALETSTYFNSGVVFTIYTSNDGEIWQEGYKSGILKGWDDAEFVKINIKDVKYLKLEAYENGDNWWSHWYDDALYANAKLIKDSYKEETIKYDLVKTVNEYDEIIKKHESSIKEGNFANIDEYELTLLQRKFVTNVGYDIIEALLNYSQEYHDVLSWLLEDKETLELYILGGTPDGNYVTSLKILNELFIKYKDDLKTANGNLYKKMIITLSLTHSASVGLWITGAPEDVNDPNGSNAVNRYAIFKELYNAGKLDNNIFENLSIEEMRFVMNNIIDDEEIIWLNDYTTKNNSRNPYSYITYTFGYDYYKSEYYTEENKTKWDQKYINNITKYGITYKENYPKLWIVFEEGSVCGGLSKTGSNINGSYGIPSSVVSQPGHAAYILMSLDKNGNKVWSLWNDVFGWGQSGKTEKLSVRMPNGWGSGDYTSNYPASYILLAQAALNDLDNYNTSEKILMIADSYSDNLEIQESIYEGALKIQNINFDAWYNLIKLYETKKASEEEFVKLAERIIENLKYYPLPMYDLINLLSKNISKASNEAKISNLVNVALEEDTKLSNSGLIQESAIKQVANYLLSSNDTEIATFSFDGDNAGKIILNERFQDNNVNWQYNLTSNANDWKDAEGISHELTKEEIELINDETDIAIRIVGDLESVYNIEIEKAIMPPNITSNDLENILNGINDTMEWKYENDDTFTKFSDKLPDLTGDKIIEVRVSRHSNYLASESITFTFTSQYEGEEQAYISNNRLTVDSVSSEETVNENNAKENAIDGNINTMWHTSWDGSDNEKYIVLKLNEPAYVSHLEYVPRHSSTNGIVKNAKVLVSVDGEEWIEVVSETDWAIDNSSKMVEFSDIYLVSYVKLIGVETNGNYMSAALINLFEDKTRTSLPTAELSYDITELTNKDVTVKLVNPSKEITILNNDGSDTYIFTENGEFTFEFVDNYGNENSVTATVDYIDKVVPEGTIEYDIITNTYGSVTATLKSNEEIIILNNDGSDTYIFTENGTFDFIYQDIAGNLNKTTAEVTWILEDKNTNNSEPNKKPEENNDNTNNNENKPNKEENKVTKKERANYHQIVLLAILFSLVVSAIIIIICYKKDKKR